MTKFFIVFLDANVLFSAAYRENNGLLRLWDLPNIKLTSSLYAVEEATRNLKTQEQLERLNGLKRNLKITTQADNRLLPKDIQLPFKDRPILSAAIAIRANYLITGDFKDFGNYFGQRILGVKILPPAEFFKEKIFIT